MYQDEISKYAPLTMDAIVKICETLVPSKYDCSPWRHPEISHGKGVLKTEDGLNCYMASYGGAHAAKALYAIQTLDQSIFRAPFEVIDWGCGQGIASMCLIEHLCQYKLLHNLKTIQLIEPGIAISRAEINLRSVVPGVKIVKHKKGLPPTCSLPFECIDNLDVQQENILHLFSNILDIETINLKEVARIVSSTGVKHVVSCFGPANCEEQRIKAFCENFDSSTTNFKKPYRNTEFYRQNTYNRHTFGCYIRNFSFVREDGKQILIPYKFFAPKQFFAGYQSDLLNQLNSQGNLSEIDCAFEVLAPFDFGASTYQDVHPILAVLNNLIVRGKPTKTSPWLESIFADKLGFSKKDMQLGTIKYALNKQLKQNKDIAQIVKYVPLGIARIQKVVVEALLTDSISLDDEWNILVKENDVPCAAIAFQELADMFNNLVGLTEKYSELRFPKVNLTIINTHYSNSPLHLENKVKAYISKGDKAIEYDMVLDISTQELCNPIDVEFSEFKAKNDCYFNVRSSERIHDQRYIYTTDRIVYKPLTSLTPQGIHETIEEQAKFLRYFLQLLFRKDNFREGQLPIMSRAMQLKSVIGLLPTGGGKSLTYQIAALLQPGVSVVVDPLVSLMKDQYDGLLKCGIDICTYINSTVSDKVARENEMKESKHLFVFLSPERLAIYRFRESLRAMMDNHVYFAYGVIDEVHCVSEWGHDFRFSYLHLGRNLYQYVKPKQTDNPDLNYITLMGLTATASFDVLADVERELSGDSAFPLDPQSTVRYENTNRLELQYRVIEIDDSRAHSKWDIYSAKNKRVADVVRETFHSSMEELLKQENINTIKSKFLERESISPESPYGQFINEFDLNTDVDSDWYAEDENNSSAIVFCPHRVGYLGVNDSSNNPGIARQIIDGLGIDRVSRYCGGDLLNAQDEFIHGETNIMVATKAFGMGIDKPNVRFTLNVNHSGSLEAYVQEAGRAGRDRKMALSVILYNDRVFNEQDPNTRLYEPVPVDYGVHKFFYDGNFIGPNFEKRVMYYLMTQQETSLMEVDEESRMSKSVRGFLGKMQDANIGDAIVAYISYKYPSRDSEILDNYLIRAGLRPIGGNHLRTADKEQRYYEALMKAIYRMCCIGIIEDYTQDYVNKEFRIVTRKLASGDYFKNLQVFLQRYFSEDRAAKEIEKAKEYRGENEMQRCLGYLTDFIYNSIATKRKQAIQDIDSFCRRAITSKKNWIDVNEDLKDDIYFYFNSKYARPGFETPNSEPFSLVDDTSEGRTFNFEHVFKYIRVIDDDLIAPGGTSKDNVKHLLGAVRLIRRALTDKNPTLDFLNVFCLLFLKADKEGTPSREEIDNSFIDGYREYKSRLTDLAFFHSQLAKFKNILINENIVDATQIKHLEHLELMAEFSIHSEWMKRFSQRFTT